MPTSSHSLLLLAVGGILLSVAAPTRAQEANKNVFARENLVAWCIVPFDGKKRGPEERAAMMARIGFKRFAYDWRAEHISTFDAEVAALKKHGITLDAFWFPADLGKDARTILDLLKRHQIKTQLWVTFGDPAPQAKSLDEKVAAAGRIIRPIAEEAAKIGCTVGLYNHGNWFGEPENQLAIIEHLKLANVGIVYNFHHGHDHLDRFPALLKKMQPHLLALNLNGMVKNGDRVGKKILPLAQGDLDLGLLKTIRASGYSGPIGILGHTQDDAEERLRDNLDGLDWLVPQLDGKAPGARPKPRTYSATPPAPAQASGWLADGKAEYRTPPLTVEVRARLRTKSQYNILVASDTKQSGAHWEIFSMAATGTLTLYIPSMTPDHVYTSKQLCDNQWHDIAMHFEPDRVRLYCDGKQVADQIIKSKKTPTVSGGLAFARLVEGTIGCDGTLEYVRLTKGLRDAADLHKSPNKADEHTIGLWHFDPSGKDAEDRSKLKNPARKTTATAPTQGAAPPSGNQLFPADPRLKVVLIDRSEKDAYLAVKADSMGRLFVGGREALFVFEPNAKGGYHPKRELFRFGTDAIIIGLEIRGNDLYVLTANALYLIPEGRVQREKLQPRRLLWGLPLDLHVSFHCLAWGPDGDLHLNHGDPLLNYGQWDRPDHWGHWILYPRPEGTKVPYTGAGGVLRIKPDGTGLQVVAGGLRGPVGLCFDRNGNLFTNDNDHESKADLYAPARLMHVTPHADFGWPRGWMASKSPDRADLLEPMIATLGRGAPCDLAYYDEPFLPDTFRHSLLMCRWDRMAVTRYPLQKRGASFTTEEHDFALGKNLHRPVGITIGRGGRIFVTSLYLAGNVVSPYCVSDLVMITRADDRPEHPFEPYDIVSISAERIWAELSSTALERRSRAHTEILRRGGSLLPEAAKRLAAIKDDDPALPHLAWLAGAAGNDEAALLLAKLMMHRRAEVRQTALRVLTEFPRLQAARMVCAHALEDDDPHVQLTALSFFFKSEVNLPLMAVVKLANSNDTYLRQTAVKLLARRATLKQFNSLTKVRDPLTRLSAVLAVGDRLTVPPVHDVPPKELPLFYPAGNAFFHTKHRFADAAGEFDLRDFGRVGSYTTAERWKAIPPNQEQKDLYDILVRALDDSAPSVQLQAVYFLSLLRDARVEPKLAQVRRDVQLKPLLAFPLREITEAWIVGPFDDGPNGTKRIHPPEQGAIELDAVYVSGDRKLSWRKFPSAPGGFNVGLSQEQTASYLLAGLQSVSRQHLLLEIRSEGAVRVWHNGRPLEVASKQATLSNYLVDVQPGSNDLLVRAQAGKGVDFSFRAKIGVVATLPEKLDSSLLAQRLKEAGAGEKISPAFLAIDWTQEASKGDVANGRRLFGTLGCVKCHAIAADQKGGGAPSLTDARKRFTVPFLVESILLPSKQIAEPFRATTITTKKGLLVTGLIVNESAESVELLLPDATRRTLVMSEIEERAASKISPMPGGVVQTPAELRDLLTYLLSENPTPP